MKPINELSMHSRMYEVVGRVKRNGINWLQVVYERNTGKGPGGLYTCRAKPAFIVKMPDTVAGLDVIKWAVFCKRAVRCRPCGTYVLFKELFVLVLKQKPG